MTRAESLSAFSFIAGAVFLVSSLALLVYPGQISAWNNRFAHHTDAHEQKLLGFFSLFISLIFILIGAISVG